VSENGRVRHIGYFQTKELAAEAYRLAATRRSAEKLMHVNASANAKLENERRLADDAVRRLRASTQSKGGVDV
jgi:hypothetical protein